MKRNKHNCDFSKRIEECTFVSEDLCSMIVFTSHGHHKTEPISVESLPNCLTKYKKCFENINKCQTL